MMSKGRQLKDRIAERGLVQAMAGHSPLSARLAAEAGFDPIWASGFELSALHGLPYVSLVSMSQHLQPLRAMAASSGLPVVAYIHPRLANAIHVVQPNETDEPPDTAPRSPPAQ